MSLVGRYFLRCALCLLLCYSLLFFAVLFLYFLVVFFSASLVEFFSTSLVELVACLFCGALLYFCAELFPAFAASLPTFSRCLTLLLCDILLCSAVLLYARFLWRFPMFFGGVVPCYCRGTTLCLSALFLSASCDVFLYLSAVLFSASCVVVLTVNYVVVVTTFCDARLCLITVSPVASFVVLLSAFSRCFSLLFFCVVPHCFFLR